MELKNLLLVVLISVAFFGFFLSTSLIMTKRGNKTSNKLLAFLIIILSIHVTKHILFTGNLDLISPVFYLVTHVVTFFFGPIIYIYTNSLFYPWVGVRKLLLHFIPGFSLLVFILVMLLKAQPSASTSVDIEFITILILLVTLLQIIHLLIYTLKVTNLINTITKALKQTISNYDQLKLRWLKELTFGLIIILIASFSYYLYMIFQGYYTFNEELDFAFITLLSLYILMIGVKSFQVPEIYIGQIVRNKQNVTLKLPEHIASNFQEKIDRYLAEHKPFLDCNLRLDNLADSLSIKSYLLSQTINQQYNKNFFDFINFYRIEEAKRLMVNSVDDSIIGIAMQSGFNSKTAFYRAFKKSTGLSPLQYIKSRKSSSSNY